MLDSSVKNIASYDQLVKKAKILRTEENHKAKELDTNYQKQQTKLIGRINDEKKEALNTTKGFSDMIINSTEALKKGSEEFVMSGKIAWKEHAEYLQISGATKCEKSRQTCVNIEEFQEGAINLAKTSAKQMILTSDEQKELELKNLLSQQMEMSRMREDLTNFEADVTKEMTALKTTLATFVDNDLKKDIPSGNTPLRVDRKFPRKIVEGTPDEQRILQFRSTIDTSGAQVPKLLDMESFDGEDSVFSTSTNLSELDAPNSIDYQETGYGSEDGAMSVKSDKENCIPNKMVEKHSNRGRDFVKPKVSKLKQPDTYNSHPNSRNESRSGSRTRREIRS